jgi:hypothetical protein
MRRSGRNQGRISIGAPSGTAIQILFVYLTGFALNNNSSDDKGVSRELSGGEEHVPGVPPVHMMFRGV